MTNTSSSEELPSVPYLSKTPYNKWYVSPPEQAVKAGIVKRKQFDNYYEAYIYASDVFVAVEQWRADKKLIKQLTEKSSIGDVLVAYYASLDFTSLAELTKLTYKTDFKGWLDKRIGGVVFSNARVNSLDVPTCQRFYETRAAVNVSAANSSLRAYRLLFNWAIRMGYTKFNPFSHVKRHRVPKRKTMWERRYVRAFLNTAFSEWKWRNVGIIFYCLYEWGQRPRDIINLKWSAINWEERSVTITQSKRKAVVKLPISNGLYSLLKQQHQDFGRQEYVAPRMTRINMKWVPYSPQHVNDIVHAIMEKAKIPEGLQLRDLRRTAITETIEGGADAVTLMQLSGHQSVHSLQPYIVHTLTGSKKAQDIRNFPTQLMEGSEDDANKLLNGQRYYFRRKLQMMEQQNANQHTTQ